MNRKTDKKPLKKVVAKCPLRDYVPRNVFIGRQGFFGHSLKLALRQEKTGNKKTLLSVRKKDGAFCTSGSGTKKIFYKYFILEI
ncbi:MAG: hypothetical protein ACI4VW_08680 [Acutalibacteraceae bacterium]